MVFLFWILPAVLLVLVGIFLVLPPNEGPNDNKEVIYGVLIVLAGHAIAFILKSSISIDILQLIYVIPLIIVASAERKKGIVKGALIAAGITFLLSFITCSSMICKPG